MKKDITNYKPYKAALLSLLYILIITGLFFWKTNTLFSQGILPRTLKLGDSGEDVRFLQKMLNKNPATAIALSGPGSQGMETDFFGTMTQAAVKRYQELYAPDILFAAGVFASTGIAGERTREHILANNTEAATQFSAQEKVPFSLPAAIPGTPKINLISPDRGGVGTLVTISGEGFASVGNIIASAYEEFRDISSPDSKTLKIRIKGPFPEEFLEEHQEFYRQNNFGMEYQLIVRNTKGVSNFMPFYFEF